MLPKPWFEEWFNSPYYHLLYNHHNEKEALAFINNLVTHLQPAPGSRMLDVACGKGRHSKALAEMGFDVTGIDLSFASINEAKQKEHDNLHFFQHDMRLPFWIRYFDYAFNFFTSFGYFRTRREHDNAIRTIANSLKPNGVFVLDYLNVNYAASHLVSSQTKVIDNIAFAIRKWQDEEHFFKQIEVEDKSGNKETYTEKVAKFSLKDFTAMFNCNGLQIQEVFGNYEFDKYHDNNSPRLLLIAGKA